MRRLISAPALLVSLLAAGGVEAAGGLSAQRLRWDGRDRPLGLIQFEPRLSWAVSSQRRGDKQTAYQVLVASDATKLLPGRADLWDSGKVVSAETLNIHYGGPTPLARQRAYWTVRVWDQDGKPSAFAPATWWEMGLYDEEWNGQWIGRPTSAMSATSDRSANYLRKAFVLPRGVKQARLYASAFGVYQISINGKPAHDTVLVPGFTDYEKRVLFQTHDVTALLRKGDNVIGAIVGGGWCTAALGGRAGACGNQPPRIMLQLEVTLASGALQTIVTDQSWHAHPGPIVSSHLVDGESYDARAELPGWDAPPPRGSAAVAPCPPPARRGRAACGRAVAARPDDGWETVEQYDREKERDLVADPGPPIKVIEDRRALRVFEPRKGVHVFDLGQNIVGWARLRVRAPAGTAISLRYAEALDADGGLHVANLGGAARATDRYIARGKRGPGHPPDEIWEPHFALHGFRYVEVTGLPGKPGLETVTGRVVHSVMAPTGQLETSSPELNRLFANILWSQRGAFLSVPTTGPQRDERLGRMLEARAFAFSGCLNFDVQGFYRKWIDDIRDAQHANAAYSQTAPRVDQHEGGAGAGTAGIMVPWALHRCYADRTGIDAHLASMGRFLGFVRDGNPDLVWSKALGAKLGDPLELGPATDPTLIATAELAQAAAALAEMARHAGPSLASHAQGYDQLAAGARAAFAQRFVLPGGKLRSDTQTAYALAIAQGLLLPGPRAQAGQHLVAALERQDHHLTTGVLGSAHLLPALSLIGRDDLAYRVLMQASCPSWLCSVKNGATTIWEHWDGWTAQKGFRPGAANSFNHYALGAVAEWMYDAIGGIALDPRLPAGRHVLVRPRPGGGLSFGRARFDGPSGPVSTSWRREGKGLRVRVSIPANCSATVTLPLAGETREGGRPLDQAPGITAVQRQDTGTTMTVASGSYDFSVRPVAP